ncbi:MAG: 16S rRNA (cytidine(1402)-2'-O)-methyltransferase [Gammaproteobacteria bacterium]
MATPIGNLDDLSGRSMQVLRSVPWVAAEDTRTSRVLLDRVGSGARTIAAHRHNERESANGIVALLQRGHDVALISDAGTPAVSDPGCRIVSSVLAAGARVVPIPGPSAVIAMISVSGLADGPFHFEGFLPSRPRQRDERLDQLARMPHPFVLFEAPHRIADTLPAIAARCGAGRWLAIGRELTKKFEEVHRCRAGEAPEWLAGDPNRRRGEYVLVVAPAGELPGIGEGDEASGAEDGAAGAPGTNAAQEAPGGDASVIDARRLLGALLEELPPSRAVRVATRASGLPHRRLYQLALELAKEGPR